MSDVMEKVQDVIKDVTEVDSVTELFEKVLYPTTFIVLFGWAALFLTPTNKYIRRAVLVPALIISILYPVILIYCMANDLTSVEDYRRLETVAKGLSNIEVALASLYHIVVMDVLVAHFMAWDFFTNYDVKPIHRVGLLVCIFFTLASGPTGFLFYFIFTNTVMKKHRLLKPQDYYRPMTHFEKLQEELRDKIPSPHLYLDKFLPPGLRYPLYIVSGIIGLICFVAMLAIYVVFVAFCVVFWTVTRPFSAFSGFSGVGGKMWPIKSVVVVAAHGRLFWIFSKHNIFVRLVFGWWLPWILEFSFFMEYLPINRNVVQYLDVLIEEFGPQFPFGDGIGFSTHSTVKELIEDPDIRKGPNSLGWTVSQAQYIFSDKTLVFYPQTRQEKFMVKQGRQVARAWIKHVNATLQKPSTKVYLKTVLPYASADGNMVDSRIIEKSFMTVFFHLVTGGELKRSEINSLDGLLNNPSPFLPSWINFLFFGGALEREGMNNYKVARDALLRYPEAPALQEALDKADSFGWEPGETVRFLAIIFAIAGAVAPATLTCAVVQRLYDDPTNNLRAYNNDKVSFILETARLHRGVPMVNMASHDPEMTVMIKGKNYAVPKGTALHASIVNANRDRDVFGRDANQFHPERDRKQLGNLLTWNGTESIMAADKTGSNPPRGCPGYIQSLGIIQVVVDRFKPMSDDPLRRLISTDRYNEIMRRDLSRFITALLTASKNYQTQWNKNFPPAADAKYPGDATQKDLRLVELHCGQTIPKNDEDDPPNPLVPFIQTVLRVGGPVEDKSGEWQSAKEAMGWRMRFFGNLFPPANVKYLWMTPYEQVANLAFGGIGCFRTKRVEFYGPNVPPNAYFVNDNTLLRRYKVRPGFQRYGAAAYFDRNCNIVGIYTAFDSKLTPVPNQMRWPWEEAPSQRQWNHALWVWKVSALALATVVDHLGKTHLIESTALAYASRKYLPATHPLRAFLKIFTYRTVSINYSAAEVLTIRKGHVERIWAFQGDDLQQIFKDTIENYEFQLLPDLIDDSMRKLDDNKYPANHDVVRFWKIVKTLVRSVLTTIYVRGPQTMDDDEDLQACLEELARRLRLDKERDLSSFKDVTNVLTSLICTGTGYHEHVGQVSDYFESPDIVGTTLREGKEIDSIQAYALLVSLVSSTGLRVPRLLDNWDHLFQRDVYATQTSESFKRFQEELENLAVEIERRNKTRKFPMQSFNPRMMESSVSV